MVAHESLFVQSAAPFILLSVSAKNVPKGIVGADSVEDLQGVLRLRLVGDEEELRGHLVLSIRVWLPYRISDLFEGIIDEAVEV